MVLHFALFGSNSPSGWAEPANRVYDWTKPDLYYDVARMCERAKFDFILFADALGIPSAHGGDVGWYVKHGFNISHDPIPTIAMMATVTKHIGLASTLTTTGYPPYLLARTLGTLDHLSGGRIGWNIVTGALPDASRNFGSDELLEHDARYDVADEYFEVARKLWESWAPDAVIGDRKNRLFADPAKVKPINHVGKYFKVAGPLNVVSSPQRRPLIIVAGTSPRGRRYAAEHGDIAISHQNTLDAMKTYVRQMREAVAAAGRPPESFKIFFGIKPIMGATEAIAQERRRLHREGAFFEEGLAYLSATLGHDLTKFDLDAPLPEDLAVTGIIGKFNQVKAMGGQRTLRELAMHEAQKETFPMCGTYEQIADQIAHIAAETGVDGFHFRSMMQDYEYVTDIAVNLMPILQEKGLAQTDYRPGTLREKLFGTNA